MEYYSEITEYEAYQDFIKFSNHNGIHHRYGIKFLDYFFMKERLETRTIQGLNYREWCDKFIEKDYVQRMIHYWKGVNGLKYAFELYSGSGSFHGFRPSIAKYIYSLYNPYCILDFCSGWGGRCLGAIDLGIPYIGFDTNQSLKSCYENMMNSLGNPENIQLFFEDSSKIDFSKYDYNLVLTSPPYIRGNKFLENYKDMPKYSSSNNFYESFLFPVIRNSYKYMKPGKYCLNLPDTMYKRVVDILGECSVRIPISIFKRKSGYSEFVYVWIKTDLEKFS